MEIELEIARASKEHEAFIYSSWLKFYRTHSQFGESIDAPIYFKRHHDVIERILSRPGTISLVASLKDDKNIIYGFLVAENTLGPAIHFCFVKGAFQRTGIAAALLKALDWNLNKCFYTHQVYGMNWILNRFPGLTYDPYMI